jgi:hypothetical protein
MVGPYGMVCHLTLSKCPGVAKRVWVVEVFSGLSLAEALLGKGFMLW